MRPAWDGPVREMASTLKSRNITIAGRRTSIRLEPYMWAALEEICERSGVTLHQFCTEVDRNRKESSLTAAVRVAVVAFYRRAAHAGGLNSEAIRAGLTGLVSVPPAVMNDHDQPLSQSR